LISNSEESMRIKRPLWLITIIKGFWPLTKFAKKSSFAYRIAYKIRKMPFLEQFVNLSPAKDDLVFFLPNDNIIPKTKSIQINESIKPENMVLPSQIVDYLIDKSKYRFIMGFCLCRYSSDCQNYPNWMGCIFIGESASKIDPKFGKLVSKKTAKEYAKKCREKGLIHMIGRAFPDVFALGVNPANKLLTICNCCQCCCGLGMFKFMPDGLRKTVGRIPGVQVKVNQEKCVGCGTCSNGICFINAIQVIDNKAVIDQLHCKACGRCVLACPQNAIETTITDKNYIKKAFKEIITRVDVK